MVLDCESLAGGMARFDSPGSRTGRNWSPDLVGSSGLVPLNNLRASIFSLLSNIKGLTIQNANQKIAVALLFPSPPLIESFVFFVLNESFTMFEGRGGDIEGFS